MPATWRVRVIDEALRKAGFRASLSECDVYGLTGDDRKAATDAIIAEQASFPMVIVNGRVVCHGELDIDAVVRAVQEEIAHECC